MKGISGCCWNAPVFAASLGQSSAHIRRLSAATNRWAQQQQAIPPIAWPMCCVCLLPSADKAGLLVPKQKRISIHPLYCSCLVQLSDARLNAREAHIRRACYFIPLYTFFPLSDPGFSTSHFLLIDRCWGLAVAKANNIPFASFYEGFSCSWKSRLSVKCKLLLCEPIARFANFTRKYPH